MGAWFIVGTCTVPVLLGLPVAALYRHGLFAPTFGFALLAVLLMATQAVLVSRNSRSLAAVESDRNRVEPSRLHLQEENERRTESQRASARLAAQSDAQYRLITNALPALVAYIDPNFCYVRANRTYEIWFGKPSSEVEGHTVEEVLGAAAETVRSHLREALKGETQLSEMQMHTLQGERTVSISHIPDCDSDLGVRGIIVQANDVTAKRREEASLRQTEKLAAVGKLASSIAHEINNPPEAVTNLLYIAQTSSNVAEIQGYLLTAEDEVGRIATITSQTLRFHKQSTRPVFVIASALLNSALQVYKFRFAEKVLVEQRHRPATELLCFDGEIRQVLNNLVGNAIDAMQGRAGILTLRSQSSRSGQTGERGLVTTAPA